VAKTTTAQLIDKLRDLGIQRHLLPENINDYFGIFASERQNVIKGVELVRHSPLIGPKVPVQGLLVDIHTGKVEWLVNGYQALEMAGSPWTQVLKTGEKTVDSLKPLTDFKIGAINLQDTKIGEGVAMAEDWVSQKLRELQAQPAQPQPPPTAPASASATPPKIPLPPPLRPRIQLRRGPK
jgi:carbonic anhydrase